MKSLGTVLFYSFLVVSVTAILITVFKTKRFFAATVLSVLQGVGALFAVNFIGSFIGVHLAVNAFSLIVSSVAGASGVALLLITQVLFR
ncbi:MAG: pro-sigmaK processing inhibitor BofA family protein [Clostridia bacterium]|nr:pro-sigmaK processing inhibitor BofA family protein [Clostridia bacterium]